jgi:hypothetical protein
MQVRDSAAGTRACCPYCNDVIQVPQLTVAINAEQVSKTLSRPVKSPASPVFAEVPAAKPVVASNGEATIYSDRDVAVTTARVLCAGTTYANGNISSVRLGETHPNAIPTLVAIAIGLCVLITALARLEFNAAVVFLFVVGIAVIAFAVRHVHQLTPDYHLFISTSSGEVQAFTSKDRTQVERIVAAINEAIVRYR